MQTIFNNGGHAVSGCSCLHCGSPLGADDINVNADTTLCRKCGAAFRFSEVIDNGILATFDPAKPPAGAFFETRADGFVATATLRSAQAWFLIPFTLVWSGGSLGGIYGTQFHTGKFDLVNSLFGLFFVAGTLFLVPQAIMSAMGRVVISCRGEEGSVFHGVGQLGRTWRFRWEDVASVQQALRKGHRGSVTRFIRVVLRTPTRAPFEFGELLSDERKGFVISVMRWQAVRWQR